MLFQDVLDFRYGIQPRDEILPRFALPQPLIDFLSHDRRKPRNLPVPGHANLPLSNSNHSLFKFIPLSVGESEQSR